MLRFCVFKKQKTQKRSILGYEFKRNILYNRPQVSSPITVRMSPIPMSIEFPSWIQGCHKAGNVVTGLFFIHCRLLKKMITNSCNLSYQKRFFKNCRDGWLGWAKYAKHIHRRPSLPRATISPRPCKSCQEQEASNSYGFFHKLIRTYCSSKSTSNRRARASSLSSLVDRQHLIQNWMVLWP